MPPRVRNKVLKASKENIGTENRLKSTRSTANRPRKVLGDKTNSASDDNLSTELVKPTKAVTKRTNVISTELEKNGRPRRDRRLPSRFVENPVLSNLSNNKDADTSEGKLNNSIGDPTKKNASTKSNITPAPSPFKTPAKAETSLVVQRPRRIGRLPSKLSDAVSPDKYIPIAPANASTPITVKSKAQSTKITEKSQKSKNTNIPSAPKLNDEKNSEITNKVSPDTNNNPKRPQRLRRQVVVNKLTPKQPATSKKTENKRVISKTPQQTLVNKTKSTSQNESLYKTFNSTRNDSTVSYKPNNSSLSSNHSSLVYSASPSPKKASPKEVAGLKKAGLRQLGKNQSMKVLGSKKSPQNQEGDVDVYEFTFDPNEEPPPQKKKRKRNVTKKPKPKTNVKLPTTVKTVVKSSYDTNISKALNALKSIVKPSQTSKLPQIQESQPHHDQVTPNVPSNPVNISQHNEILTNPVDSSKNTKDNTNATYTDVNYASIRIEDIAADIEPSIDHDINYSPVNSPRPPTPQHPVPENQNVEIPQQKSNDPLNLIQELSFFDEEPVASSSMNSSVRHPLASPWRVEFGRLPIKWNVNTYVKPNMTPAVESSFISAEDTKKRHVYTNMVPQENEPLPEIISTPNYKQTSIISFIREVAEKSAQKKMRKSKSPAKTSLFDDTNTDTNKQQSIENVLANSNSTNDTSKEKEKTPEKRKTRKRKNDEKICSLPAKSPRKDKDCTYFGFDDSENQDTENISPVKNNPLRRTLRQRRPVLQELNGPARAVLPTTKSKLTSSEAVNKVYEELKSGSDAPAFVENNINLSNVEELMLNDDSQSVHLFEDIDIVHHLKPTRKSYGKAKKVTFQQHSSDSEEVPENVEHSSDEDDMGDFTFEVPNVEEKKKVKKKKPKKLMSKKEEKEANEWAAGFNSMCEDIEEFPLLIE